MARCMKCDFFRPRTNETGNCHKNPPLVVVINNRKETVFPEVSTDDICGYYNCNTDEVKNMY